MISSSVMSMSRDICVSSEIVGIDKLSRKVVCELISAYSEEYKVLKKCHLSLPGLL